MWVGVYFNNHLCVRDYTKSVSFSTPIALEASAAASALSLALLYTLTLTALNQPLNAGLVGWQFTSYFSGFFLSLPHRTTARNQQFVFHSNTLYTHRVMIINCGCRFSLKLLLFIYHTLPQITCRWRTKTRSYGDVSRVIFPCSANIRVITPDSNVSFCTYRSPASDWSSAVTDSAFFL